MGEKRLHNRGGAALALALRRVQARSGPSAHKVFSSFGPGVLVTPAVRAHSLAVAGNPTGAVCPRETMVEIAQLCKKYNAWLVVDQAYEHFLHGDQRCGRSIATWDIMPEG